MSLAKPFVKYTIILMILVLALDSKAQKFSLGVKAGPSITIGRFRDSDLRDIYSNRTKVGFTGGGFISFPLAKDYSFIAEGGFSRKGKKLKFSSNEWTNNAKFNFIDLSMALRKSFDFQLRPDFVHGLGWLEHVHVAETNFTGNQLLCNF